MSAAFDRISSLGLTLAALAIAAVVVHKEFTVSPAAAQKSAPPTYLPDWTSLLASGRVIGNANAPVKVIEFGDFECPFCRISDSLYRKVSKKFGDRVALIFIHYPLRTHKFATLAAYASECAAAQGRFAALHDKLYDEQDSLGLKSWGTFANEAAVPDTVLFNQCLKGSAGMPNVQTGLAAGNRIQVHATPTVLINGWRFSLPPTEQQFDSAIVALSKAQ